MEYDNPNQAVYQYANSAQITNVQPTLKHRLDAAVNQAEERLRIAKEAREIFAKNPDLERLLDLMRNGAF